MSIENQMAEASKALKKAALNESAKSHLLENTSLYGLLKKAANRYVAGEQLAEVIIRVIEFNARGLQCTVDFMGESVRNAEEANKATGEFLKLAHEIVHANLDCTISLDLSHIGLTIDKHLGFENLEKICATGLEVMISAEGMDRTDRVLEAYLEASRQYKNLGITMQAYLHRSEDDFQELIKHQGKIRIVKGAFDTPDGTALNRGAALNDRYLNYVKVLLEKAHNCSIATHDPIIQNAVISLLSNIASPGHYEFESLLGIQNEALFKLNGQHPTRVYLVYGTEWYLYLCNRMAEYPPSIFQAVVDIVE